MVSVRGHVKTSDLTLLLRRAQRGDREAFGHVYSRFHQLVLHFFWCAGCTYEESWDLMQETFLHAMRGLGTLDLQSEVRLGGWLRRIALNVLRKYHAKGKRLRFQAGWADGLPQLPDERPPGGDSVLSEAVCRALVHCMEALKEDERRIVIYRFFWAYSSRRTAGILRVAESTLRGRLNSALARLRSCLTERGVQLD